MAGAVDPMLQVILIADYYTLALLNGALLPDATALRDTAEALAIAERSGDDPALFVALEARGIVLVHQDGPQREHGFDLLAEVREAGLQERISILVVPVVDIQIAKERLRTGDLDGAIELSRAVIDDLFSTGRDDLSRAAHQRLGGSAAAPQGRRRRAASAGRHRQVGGGADRARIRTARAATAAAAGTAGPSARDEAAYRDYRDRYRAMATSLGFEGHMEWAEAMP